MITWWEQWWYHTWYLANSIFKIIKKQKQTICVSGFDHVAQLELKGHAGKDSSGEREHNAPWEQLQKPHRFQILFMTFDIVVTEVVTVTRVK